MRKSFALGLALDYGCNQAATRDNHGYEYIVTRLDAPQDHNGVTCAYMVQRVKVGETAPVQTHYCASVDDCITFYRSFLAPHEIKHQIFWYGYFGVKSGDTFYTLLFHTMAENAARKDQPRKPRNDASRQRGYHY